MSNWARDVINRAEYIRVAGYECYDGHPARGCDSHIFTDPACAACTAIQAKYPKKRKLNPKHPLNALDGERE